MIRNYAFIFPVRGITKDNEKIFNKKGRFFLSKKFKDFEKLLRWHCTLQTPGGFLKFQKHEDLQVNLHYVFKKRTHADCQNLPKSTLDAFNSLLWEDDRQIKKLFVEIIYRENEEIRMEVCNLK